ncbi:MAG: hypothetical protein R3B47_14235 [Bacteroidia bacterium]
MGAADGYFRTNKPDSVVVLPPADQQYIVTVKDSNGCVSTDTVNVLIDQTLSVFVREDTTICRGATAPFARGYQRCDLYLGSGATVDDPNSLSTLLRRIQPQPRCFRLFRNEAVNRRIRIEIEVYEVFTPEDTSLVVATRCCWLPNGVSFAWTPNDWITYTLASPRIWPDQSTVYTVEAKRCRLL